ncbi:MAG: beta galactosidase jelly roll domain-containing protein [Kiritimatiellaeota bacterium]|nr:beta galactosidase jelly roll domain-containing protein [Kiritimatiellota bacterium]
MQPNVIKHTLIILTALLLAPPAALRVAGAPEDQQPLSGAQVAMGRGRVLWPGTWKFVGSENLEGAEAAGFNDSAWTTVTVPHTWASRTNLQTYASAWYRSRFTVPANGGERRTYICFEGVATVAEVFVNGQRMGGHRGAYTRFSVDATDAVKPGADNVLAVKVNNTAEATAECLPSGTQKQLYHVYGGI